MSVTDRGKTIEVFESSDDRVEVSFLELDGLSEYERQTAMVLEIDDVTAHVRRYRSCRVDALVAWQSDTLERRRIRTLVPCLGDGEDVKIFFCNGTDQSSRRIADGLSNGQSLFYVRVVSADVVNEHVDV